MIHRLRPTLRAFRISMAASVLCCSLLASLSPEEEKNRQNPLAGDPDAVAVGKGLFRFYCAHCHGEEGMGGFRGPDLIRRRLTRASGDAEMFQIIKHGIQGTQMPPLTHPDDTLWRIMAYVADTRSKTEPRKLTGNREAGRDLFFGKGFCDSCHMIQGKGGRLGPDLTGIGGSRSVDFLEESIREPSAQFRNVRQIDGRMAGGYESIRLITGQGETITGVIRNEDTFTIQILDQKENFYSFVKNELDQIIRLENSLMPAYPESVLSKQELEDLVTFLAGGPEEKEMNR